MYGVIYTGWMDDNLASHTKRFIARSVPRVVIALVIYAYFQQLDLYMIQLNLCIVQLNLCITTRVVASKRIILPVMMEQPLQIMLILLVIIDNLSEATTLTCGRYRQL